MNLIKGINEELRRNRELLKMYEEIPQGAFGATMIRQSIEKAEKSLENGDIVEMVKCLKDLQESK